MRPLCAGPVAAFGKNEAGPAEGEEYPDWDRRCGEAMPDPNPVMGEQYPLTEVGDRAGEKYPTGVLIFGVRDIPNGELCHAKLEEGMIPG